MCSRFSNSSGSHEPADEVVWSHEAAGALVALETRLAQRYSSDNAARIVEELVRRVDRLADHPQLAHVMPEYGIEQRSDTLRCRFCVGHGHLTTRCT
jgi:plasmid stabilization system protein ParE